MLIAFSGCQSSGKTTLLQECKKMAQFEGYIFINEVTRRIKNQFGVDINSEAANYNYTQSLITADHIKNSTLSDAVLDRCSLDGLVYTNYLYNKNKVSRYIYEFAGNAYLATVQNYSKVFYTDPSIPLVNDGVRSTDIDFRNEIIDIFNDHKGRFKSTTGKEMITLTGTVEERLQQIKNAL